MCTQQLVTGQAALGLVSELGHGIPLLGLVGGFLTAGWLRGRQLLPGGSGSTMRLLEKPAEAASPL